MSWLNLMNEGYFSPELAAHFNKSIWTEKDFYLMAWHDCPIYGVGRRSEVGRENANGQADTFVSELYLDIDYPFPIVPVSEETAYSDIVWGMAPCTLLFKNVDDFRTGDLDLWNAGSNCEILNWSRSLLIDLPDANYKNWKWIFSIDPSIDLAFTASDFIQYKRLPPYQVFDRSSNQRLMSDAEIFRYRHGIQFIFPDLQPENDAKG